MITDKKIQNVLSETYDSGQTFKTTIAAVVDLVVKKYPETSRDEIKETLGKMKGWKRTGETLHDQAEISPDFFK